VAVGCVSRTVGQCKQEAQRCLTLRSSGAPTAWRTGHQAQGLRPILRLLSSTPRCWLPLTSNVRRHIPTMQYASVLIQILRPVCTSFLRGQCPASAHTLRQVPALRRSRPSAFAVAGVACLHSPIGHGQAKQSLVVVATRRAFGAVCSHSVHPQPAWRCGRQFGGRVSPSSGARRQGSQAGWGGFSPAASVAQQSCGAARRGAIFVGRCAAFLVQSCNATRKLNAA
jgi:hypothetical protein